MIVYRDKLNSDDYAIDIFEATDTDLEEVNYTYTSSLGTRTLITTIDTSTGISTYISDAGDEGDTYIQYTFEKESSTQEVLIGFRNINDNSYYELVQVSKSTEIENCYITGLIVQ